MYDRGTIDVVLELDKILAFNDVLLSLKSHPDAHKFARGIAPISLVGNITILLRVVIDFT